MKLNEKISYYRKKNQYSQEMLAEKLGVSRQAVSKWELGDAVPELDKIVALAKLFSITTDALLSESAPEANSESAADSANSAPRPAPDHLTAVAKLVRRKGYLAGYVISAYGAAILAVGTLARLGFSAMLAPVMDFPGGFDGTSGFFGDAPHLPPLTFPLTFATILMVFGALVIVGGLVLAFVLKRKGNS